MINIQPKKIISSIHQAALRKEWKKLTCLPLTGNSPVLPSDVAALKELFPDTGDLTIKRALEISTGSRDQAAVSLMNLDEPDEPDHRNEEKINRDSDDCVELTGPFLDNSSASLLK